MKCEGVTFAFGPRLSQAPGSPVVMPAGTMPGPPGSGLRDRPREPHSLRSSDRIRKAPFGERALPLVHILRRKSICCLCMRDKTLILRGFWRCRQFVSSDRKGDFERIKCGPMFRPRAPHSLRLWGNPRPPLRLTGQRALRTRAFSRPALMPILGTFPENISATFNSR